MSELPIFIPSAADYLPDWSRKRFVVLEQADRWAPVISAEVASQVPSGMTAPVFESCASGRDAAIFAELRNTSGFVIFLSELERDTLGLLARLGRQSRPHRILAAGTDLHRELYPVLFEAGVDTILVNERDELRIANWCLRVAALSKS